MGIYCPLYPLFPDRSPIGQCLLVKGNEHHDKATQLSKMRFDILWKGFESYFGRDEEGTGFSMPSKLIEVRSGLFSLLSSFFIRRIFLSLKGVTVMCRCIPPENTITVVREEIRCTSERIILPSVFKNIILLYAWRKKGGIPKRCLTAQSFGYKSLP